KLRKAVVKDGAELVGTPMQTPAAGSRAGMHLIAAKCDNNNYHFVRRDEATGLWYSKVPMSAPGVFFPPPFTPIANDWNPSQPLTNQGFLAVWIGYFWVPDAGL